MATVTAPAEACTSVVSRPIIKSLLIKRSRSTDGSNAKCKARKRSDCRTTFALINPTSAMNTRTESPAWLTKALSGSATIATPERDMSRTRPVERAPLAPNIHIGSSSSKRSSVRCTGACSDIMQTRNSTTTLIPPQIAIIGSNEVWLTICHSGMVLMMSPPIVRSD